MAVVELSCDFLVAGGGMAGVCAALAAARNGAKVVLAQDRSRLGGNASSEVRMHIVGANEHGGRPGWREGGIIEELRLENAARNPHSAWELWDLLLYDKVVSEPNITLLLDTSVFRAEISGGVLQSVWARSDKTEHFYHVAASQYADCTGDCRLGLEAGAAHRTGHEARAEFGEPLAPETAGPETLGSSILFTSKDYGKPIPFVPPSWARKVTKDQLEFRGTGSWEYGYWWIEWGGQHDAIADNEMIRKELLSIVLGVWDYVKNSGEHPDSANWGMDWIGMIPGKRSSRRLEGPIILTQRDLQGEAFDFQDAVAIGGWPFDDHPPGGFDAPQERPARQVKIDDVYNIPLRALFSRNIGNLFMAGRNISASHVAFTSTRVMATCAVMGQAVGTAAAYCAREKMLPAALAEDNTRIAALQQMLLRDDQTIRDRKNDDPADLARSAKATASASVEGSAPEHVLDGETRDIPGNWRHRWGGPMDPGPAWLELRWDTPQRISEIQITFDSGFQRELTLSENAGVRKRVVAGPQPETVADYGIEYQRSGDSDWQPLAKITGNFQRLRRHRFDTVNAAAIRLTVTATNGADEARVYEIRCYA
ncbi:MAG: FAD-dependent oxidoreductase [Candidatus Hydrogenedens sp.]|nr:FAD-dependent oxidoreductase [Candidatus Hydrogenedens sp.]